MRHGGLVVTTAIYRSQCPCDVTLEIARGASVPRCPQCKHTVEWVYQRSTYRPAPLLAPEQNATPTEAAPSSWEGWASGAQR